MSLTKLFLSGNFSAILKISGIFLSISGKKLKNSRIRRGRFLVFPNFRRVPVQEEFGK
jgi:hypothetical protein